MTKLIQIQYKINCPMHGIQINPYEHCTKCEYSKNEGVSHQIIDEIWDAVECTYFDDKSCEQCEHINIILTEEPCKSCYEFNKFEPNIAEKLLSALINITPIDEET